MTRHPTSLFYEKQELRERTMALILPLAGVFLIGFFVYAMVRQLVLGKPFGDEPMSDTFLIFFGVFYIVLGGLLVMLFFKGRLITEVRPDGLFVRFHPFHRRFKHYRPDDLAGYDAVTYRPIRDFGGWGIRVGPRGRAYNISGNRGVQLEFKNGKRLMLGSRKPEAMVTAIQSIAR